MLWLRDRHPKEPLTWRADVRDAEKRVAVWAAGKLRLASDEDAFENLWGGDHKVTFSRVQHGKCAYCEMSISSDSAGGKMDHRRPKAQVAELVEEGDEIPGHNSRDPKKPRRVRPIGRGYWWLAYAWRNLLLACGTCNEKWKGTLFPIEGGHRRAPTRKSCASERPLLLDPFGDVDPADHLEFDRVGQVAFAKGSEIGRETIRTCHLWRETLRSNRAFFVELAWPAITQVIAELGAVPRDERRLRRALGRLLPLGKLKSPHAGMVRILWRQRDVYGLAWADLRALHRKLGR